MKKNHQISTKNALINLFLTLKNYSSHKKSNKTEENYEYLLSMDEIGLIKYIKDCIDTTILSIVEKKINDYKKKYSNQIIQEDYESMLIKYEKDIRGHIRTEHQLKLYADSLQYNIEELEKEKKNFNNNKNYKDILIEKNNEIDKLKKEIKHNKNLLKSYEEENIKLTNNEKKLKNIILKLEKKYKNEIEILNKKNKYYYEKLKFSFIDKEEIEKKRETIYCNSSRHPNNPKLIKKYLENENNNTCNVNRMYRNRNNHITISNNRSTSLVQTHPYEKLEKYLLSKYPRNGSKDQYQYINKMKNSKNSTHENHSRDKNLNKNTIHINSISNNSYIAIEKEQEKLMNKYKVNDSSLNNTIKKNRKVCHRNKSIENNNNSIKNKQINVIKNILMSNNNSNGNNNSIKNKHKSVNKGNNNTNNSMLNNISCKKITGSNNSSTVNSSKNYMNKSCKEINYNGNSSNIFGNKSNIASKFVNDIYKYSKNEKQNTSINIYFPNNLKKYSANSSWREMLNNNNNINNTNNIHINGNKNQIISYRNKQKEGKLNSFYTNSIQKYN